MTIENHHLHNEFPEFNDQIRELKMNNRHFSKLFDEYHHLDRDVRRIEDAVEVSSDEHLENLKLRRLHLKDELFTMLKQAKIQ
ncbi:MAG: YdcH family protein [Psychrobium sp.]